MPGSHYFHAPTYSSADNIGANSEPSSNYSQHAPMQLATPHEQQPSQSSVSQCKKRKIDRACDLCRRRKTKCDGPRMPNSVCTNCLQSQKECTYMEESKPRGPPKAYVTGLEDRLEKMEALLKRLRPDSDFSEELGSPVVRGSWKNKNGLESKPIRGISGKNSSSKYAPTFSTSTSSPLPPTTQLPLKDPVTHMNHGSSSVKVEDGHPSNAAEDENECLSDIESSSNEMDRLRLTGRQHNANSTHDLAHSRFLGQSSSILLIEATRKFKQLHMAETGNSPDLLKSPSPASSTSYLQRPEFWKVHKWENKWEGFHLDSQGLLQSIMAEMPPDDLSTALLDLYFMHVNIQFPLLHRPTFIRQWKEKLYMRNIWFACLCFCIFSIGSRWSDDPRVLPPVQKQENNGAQEWLQGGLHYYLVAYGIHRVRRSLLYPATLFEIQSFSLLAMFDRGTSVPSNAWTMLSIGIRKAQDIGAHRKPVYSEKPTLDEELWRRAFWLLVSFERMDSAVLGRSSGFGEEDFDLDLPLNVDDEYWEAEKLADAFKQPSDIPSKAMAFNLWLKLSQILAFTIRTIYALNNSKTFIGRFALSQRDEIIAQLNEAMTDWVDSVPSHLKWSNHIPNPIYSNQSATLYTSYYLVQILIYKPFISSPSKPPVSEDNKRLAYPALAICTNAAKSCARIVEAQVKKGYSNVPNLIQVRDQMQRVHGMDEIKPIAHLVDNLMEDVNIFLGALEWASHRYEVAVLSLQQLKQALPTLESVAPDYGRNQSRMPDFNTGPRRFIDSISIPPSPFHTLPHIDSGIQWNNSNSSQQGKISSVHLNYSPHHMSAPAQSPSHQMQLSRNMPSHVISRDSYYRSPSFRDINDSLPVYHANNYPGQAESPEWETHLSQLPPLRRHSQSERALPSINNLHRRTSSFRNSDQPNFFIEEGEDHAIRYEKHTIDNGSRLHQDMRPDFHPVSHARMEIAHEPDRSVHRTLLWEPNNPREDLHYTYDDRHWDDRRHIQPTQTGHRAPYNVFTSSSS